MNNMIVKRLSKLVDEGDEVENDILGGRWAFKVRAFLEATDAADERNSFVSLSSTDFWDTHALRLGYLQGLLAKAEANAGSQVEAEVTSKKPAISPPSKKHDSRKVFIVHGHDENLKSEVELFLHSIKLEPIILHKKI